MSDSERIAQAPLVRVRGLSVGVDGTGLVSDIDFDMRAGQTVVVVGNSGAGKSTIAAAVAGVLPPHFECSGSVSLVPGCRVGYLPQDATLTLNPARRIGAALGELAKLHSSSSIPWRARRRWRTEQVESLLAQAAFHMEDGQRNLWPRRFPFEFSGGQRTRLALAQVLAVRPDVLVLDEPSTGLDTMSRQLLVEALIEVRDRGVATLLVTHDEYVAAELGDIIIGIRDGRFRTGRNDLRTARTPRHVEPIGRQVEAVPAKRVLDLEHVNVRMSGVDVLRDISLSVGQGQLIGLTGASGSGKTTLLRAVAGLVPVTSGRLSFDGSALPRLGRRDLSTLADVQYVCQEVRDSFEPDRPVVDQVARTAVRLRGVTPKSARLAALDLLEELGLNLDQAERRPDGLSGGQLRRVAIARSLAARPRVLLCDEITTGLERPLSKLILDALHARRRELGTAVIVAGHDVGAMVEYAERLVVLSCGQLTDDVAQGCWTTASPGLRELLIADGIALDPSRS